MHQTQYTGQIITNFFPVLISIYRNDQLSTEFTEGMYQFEMQASSSGAYQSYMGGSIDAVRGRYGRVFAKKVHDLNFVRKFENGSPSDEDWRRLIESLFGGYPIPRAVEAPTLIPQGATVIVKSSGRVGES